MANKTHKDIRVRSALLVTSVLVNYTPYLNQASLQRAINLLDDSALSDTNRSVLTGLAGTTITLNGFVNTTTDAYYGPLVNAATSVLRTMEYRIFSTNSTGSAGQFYRGSVLVSNVQYSGAVDSLQTFSADHTFDGAVTRTSTSSGGN
jgi:hypothetical protein